MSFDNDLIVKTIRDMEKDAERIKKKIFEICIWMRGGITLNEAWGMSALDRNMVIETINKFNKETSGDTTEYL